MTERTKAVLRLENIAKHYLQGDREVEALPPFSLEAVAGEQVALVGASGCGKSTLLQIAGLLRRPDSGEVIIDGTPCSRLKEREATRLRRHKLGFVYQFHHLLPELSAVENVAVPLWLTGVGRGQARDEAASLLAEMGLGERTGHMPGQLSGGEQQRVAIARALIHRPALFLADEPTGNLDPKTGRQVEEIMQHVLQEREATALIVTHNPEMAARMSRVITLGREEATTPNSR